MFEGDGLEPGTHAELMQGLSDVLVDSSSTDPELLRDRFGREPGKRPNPRLSALLENKANSVIRKRNEGPGSGGGSQRSVGVDIAPRPVRGLAFGPGAGTGCSKV